MGLKVMSIADNPSYFFTSTNLKKIHIANVLYKTTVENLDFTPSNECVELRFFTVEEAKKEQTYPNIQEFLKLYTI